MKPIKEILFKKINSTRVIAELASYIDSLEPDKEYRLEVYEPKKKRSLSANALFWKMCGDLAERLRIPKEDIYRSYIREIGGNCEVLQIKTDAVPHFANQWNEGHIGRFVDVIEDYEVTREDENGRTYTETFSEIIVYYGSSDYDRATMSRLIDMCKQDCIELDIKTYDDEELERLCEEWGV